MKLYEGRLSGADANAPSNGVDRRMKAEPWIAVLLSVLMPGLGHGYCQMWLRGLTFFLLATGFAFLGMVSAWANFAGMTFLSSFGAFFYALCIGDAYRCSVKSRLGRVPWLSGSKVAAIFASALVLFMGAFFVVVTGTMAVHFVGQAVTIASDSMQPSLQRGDKVLANKQFRSASDLHGGDLVALEAGPGRSSDAVLRAVAVPGERVSMTQGRVLVDGKVLDEPYASYRQDPLTYPANSRASSFSELTVPPGTLFLLADVRDSDEDSREWGPIGEGMVIGRVDFRFYPPTRHRQFADSYLSKLTHKLLIRLGWGENQD